MCLSSSMFTLKLNCSGKGNSPSVSNDSELAGCGGGRLHSARDQDASSNDAKGAQSAVGGRIWDRLLHISLPHRGCKPFKPVTTETTQSLPAADSSSRVLLQQTPSPTECLCQT